jgi:cytosine/adenosine deaminase-related metal-dependent hydrolase
MNEEKRVCIDGCAIATVDAAGTEFARGHIVVERGRIAAIGTGPGPQEAARRINGEGCLATPGLVNCHHHLYQWLTRGLAQDAGLFEWLTALYPVWAHIDAEMEHDAATAGLLTLQLSGCATSSDHHYVFPRRGGDLFEASVAAAERTGIRFHACRGSMDLGASAGGLPPDEVVETTEQALDATEEAIDRYHDPSFGAMFRVAVAPCSPFSATLELMREAAELARRRDVRLHTHLAETPEEEGFCRERFGKGPVDLVDELGWLGPDVWLAHCVHLRSNDVAALARTATGVAHCPSSNGRLGAGIAPVRDLLSAGVLVGLGVDGSASNEPGELAAELRAALLAARMRDGPSALTARTALALATRHGAHCLGREKEVGSLEVGKAADIALWKLDDLGHAGIEDPVAALVLGPVRRVHELLIDGVTVVSEGRAVTVDEEEASQALTKSSRRLAERAGLSA